jgi:hypothetical protein
MACCHIENFALQNIITLKQSNTLIKMSHNSRDDIAHSSNLQVLTNSKAKSIKLENCL